MTEFDYKIITDLMNMTEEKKQLEYENDILTSKVQSLKNEIDNCYIKIDELEEFFEIGEKYVYVKTNKETESKRKHHKNKF